MENVDYTKNAKEYAHTNKKSVDVLRYADGKRHYTEIAKIVGIHPTRVSGLLRKAEILGLAKNIKLGIYKRKPVLGYMPKNNGVPAPVRTTLDLMRKIVKKKKPLPITGFNIQSTIFSNIDQMTAAYTRLYAVENSLRALIRKVIGGQSNWWSQRVPRDIQIDVQDTITRTPYHAVKRKDELEYTHLGQLMKIIISKKNWNDFLQYLKEKDRNAFRVTISRAIASRNAIGHCITLKLKDLQIVNVRFEDILGML